MPVCFLGVPKLVEKIIINPKNKATINTIYLN